MRLLAICHLAQYVVILFAPLRWDTTCNSWSEESRSRFLISPLSFIPHTCHFCVHTKEENSWWTPKPLNVDFHIRSNSLTGLSERSEHNQPCSSVLKAGCLSLMNQARKLIFIAVYCNFVLLNAENVFSANALLNFNHMFCLNSRF